MTAENIKGYEVITALGTRVHIERMKYVKDYFIYIEDDKFKTIDEVQFDLEMFKSFGCQIIAHTYEDKRIKETLVIPEKCWTIQTGFKAADSFVVHVEIVKSIYAGKWYRDIMKADFINSSVLRTYEIMTTEEVMNLLQKEVKRGNQILYFNDGGGRIYG